MTLNKEIEKTLGALSADEINHLEELQAYENI